MPGFEFDAENEDDTRRLATALARCVQDGTCIALIGTLGAGKTRLAQALAGACGIDPAAVTSPTFVLCQSHHGRRTVHHMDAYRLNDLDEFFEIGPEEYFESDGLTLLEWADRVRGALPDRRIEIRIEVTGPTRRRFRIETGAETLQPVLDRIEAELDRPPS